MANALALDTHVVFCWFYHAHRVRFVSKTRWENLSSEFLTKRNSNQSPQLQRLASEISPVASLDMLLSEKRITKALIRLRCLRLCRSQTPEDRFSHIEGKIQYVG